MDYPARFGPELVTDIKYWGRGLLDYVEEKMIGLAPFSPLPESERERLRRHLAKCPEVFAEFGVPEYDHTGLIYCRQVTCPHCSGEAPLLNTLWLSKEAGDPWGVRVVTDGKPTNGKVWFETNRVHKGKGPNGEDPNEATVNRGAGQCVHCRQAIDGDEVKAQARGESPHGKWSDRLYAVVAVRLEPKLDKHGLNRDDIKHRFLRGEIDVLVCTDAAAEGLNLQTANLLVNFDLPWNPMKVEQRIGRIDRIGQRHSTIFVSNLCYLNSAEEIATDVCCPG